MQEHAEGGDTCRAKAGAVHLQARTPGMLQPRNRHDIRIET